MSHYLMSDYLVIYETSEDGGWGAYCPDLPGCVAAAKSRAEVERLMHEAVSLHLQAMRDVGEPLPTPRHLAGSVAA